MADRSGKPVAKTWQEQAMETLELGRNEERAKICEALRKWAFQASKESDHDALYAAAVMLEHNCDDDDWEPAPT